MVDGQGRPHANKPASNSSHLCETLAKGCRVVGEINLKPYRLISATSCPGQWPPYFIAHTHPAVSTIPKEARKSRNISHEIIITLTVPLLDSRSRAVCGYLFIKQSALFRILFFAVPFTVLAKDRKTSVLSPRLDQSLILQLSILLSTEP
jgi:hypothetical protein